MVGQLGGCGHGREIDVVDMVGKLGGCGLGRAIGRLWTW